MSALLLSKEVHAFVQVLHINIVARAKHAIHATSQPNLSAN